MRRRARAYSPLLSLLLATLVLSGLWTAVHGYLAALDLRAVQRDLVSLEALGARADSPGAVDQLVSDVRQHADRARARTDDLAWKVWSHTPLLGSTLTVTTGVSATASDLARYALPALAQAALTVPELRAPDGTLHLSALHAQAVALQQATDDVQRAHARIASLPTSRVGLVERNRLTLQSQLGRLVGRAQGLAVAASQGPELLGELGTRRYLIAVQNNAESRASGGIVGAYGLLTLNRGRAVLQHFGPDTDLRGTSTNAIDLGAEWRSRYDALGAARDWREVTATPDFPTAGRMMLALWAATHSGQQLDGVLSADPVALANVLQATGPVTRRDGVRLEAATFVQRALSDVYRDYPDKARRSAVLTEDTRAVFQALTQGAGQATALAERLGNAVVSQHLKLFSAHPTTQAALMRTAVAASLPVDAAPLLGVVTQDANADKLSYYLRRRITYAPALAPQKSDFGDGHGPRSQETATLTVGLTNAVPTSGLPDYVAPAVDLSDGAPIRRGQMRVAVSVYLGRSGQLDDAQLDGVGIGMTSQTERGLAVFTTTLTLDPGSTRTLLLHVRQPVTPGEKLLVLQQPLSVPDIQAVPASATLPTR